MAFEKCKRCQEYDWLDRHKCPPIFYVINREEWFDYKDEREISDLTQEEYNEIDWYRAIRATSATVAAERYLENACHNGDGIVESMDVYVKDGMENITRHRVLAQLVVDVHESKKTEIKMPEHIEMCV